MQIVIQYHLIWVFIKTESNCNYACLGVKWQFSEVGEKSSMSAENGKTTLMKKENKTEI